jgi:hypothetical protein
MNNSNNSMDLVEDYTLTFREVLENIKKSLSQEILDNISDETCFVCLLHLANEKSNSNNFVKN